MLMTREYNPLSDAMTMEEDSIVVVDYEPEMDVQELIDRANTKGIESLSDEEYAFLMLEINKEEDQKEIGHFDNLAEHIDQSELKRIANKVIEWVDDDIKSRSDWYELEKSGIRLLGVSPNVEGGANFKGASKAVHPMLAEACIQFNSRAIEALWPAGGPVKSTILGKKDKERIDQATRVEQFMNYQYTELIPGAFDQVDQMLIRLPLSGSFFVKSYNDPIDGVTRRAVEPVDFIVPYRATDLETSPRYTERVMMSKNDVRKRQVAGLYLDIELIEPNEDTGENERTIVTDEIEATEGRENIGVNTYDDRRTLYECVCEYDLPGFEDVDEQGNVTEIALQYVITIDKDSQDVLSIYRNWKSTDHLKKRIVYHTHYRFMPGLGFYGYGLYHWMANLARSASGAIRALLDAAQFSNIPGGFRSKDAKIKNGDVEVGPGEWKDVDCDAQDLKGAFFPLPYKEPSSVLFNLLGHLEELGRRISSTADDLVGDSNQNTPVGTVLARIEQGMKVFTAIQKRLHVAAKKEFKITAWLNSMFMPDKYPYAVENEDRVVLKEDFDERVDVVPVSDPNMASNIQRYFIQQAVMELAGNASPGLYDERALHRRALESLRIEDIDELLPNPGANIKRMGPVEENAMVILGQPVKSFMEQNHQAHLIVHQQLLLQGLGKDQEQAAQALHAHIQEHVAMAYLIQMQLATGEEFMLPGGEDDEEGGGELPVEVENQLAVMAAQAAEQFMRDQLQPDPEMMEMEADQERKDFEAQRDADRKDAIANADIERKDATALADMHRKNQQQIENLFSRNQPKQ